jgi:hypothetical protein
MDFASWIHLINVKRVQLRLFVWVSARATAHSPLLAFKRAACRTHSYWLTLTLSLPSSRGSYGPHFLQFSHIIDTLPTILAPTWTGLSLWRRRQYIPPKRRKTYLPQGIETQKKANWSAVAVETYKPIMLGAVALKKLSRFSQPLRHNSCTNHNSRLTASSCRPVSSYGRETLTLGLHVVRLVTGP